MLQLSNEFLDNPLSGELREKLFFAVVRRVLVARGIRPPISLVDVDWDDPRIAPYEAVPDGYLSRLSDLSAEGYREVPASPNWLIHNLMIDEYRKWTRLRGVEISWHQSADMAVYLANLALGDSYDTDASILFRTLLKDLKSFVSTFNADDRLIAYFALPKIKSCFACLLIEYGVCTIAALAAELGRTEAQVIALMAEDVGLEKYIARETGKTSRAVEGRGSRIVKGLNVFAANLPYIVEICRAIRG